MREGCRSRGSGLKPRRGGGALDHHRYTRPSRRSDHFYENEGSLSVDLNLLDADGTLVFTETRSARSQDTMDQIGGNRYAWFTFATVDNLPIDNHEIYNGAPRA